MQLSKFIATTLIGVLLILGACAGPATTPPPTQTPTTPAPTTPAPNTPAPTTPTPTTPTPATPTPATPAPATPTTPTGPAKFEVSDLKATPERIEPKDTTTVTVVVKNTGGQSGTYTVVLQANGEEYKRQDITLNGGASQTITFGVSFDKELGRVTLSVENLSTVLRVEVF